MHATGTFEVSLAVQKPDQPEIERRTLDKKFHGDLEGTSKGVMLSAGNAATGAGGYVAMEIVTGTLKGRTGTFAMQHSGTMEKGSFQLDIVVVPGSGTGQLAGISGKFKIIIEQGKHS